MICPEGLKTKEYGQTINTVCHVPFKIVAVILSWDCGAIKLFKGPMWSIPCIIQIQSHDVMDFTAIHVVGLNVSTLTT